MSDPLFDQDDEANTPLTAEERDQLIPSYISLRRELNQAEQVNIAGDLLAVQLGMPRLSWGRLNLVDPSASRAAYVAALRQADAHDLGPLIAFARS